MQKKNFISRIYRNTHLWIVLTCIGVWVLVFHSIFSGRENAVYVVGGNVKADVSGSVSVDNTVDVNGSVSVDNTVDVNLSEINGYDNCFYNSYDKHPKDYYRIPVATY